MTVLDLAVHAPADIAREAAGHAVQGELDAAERMARALLAARPHDYAARRVLARVAYARGERAVAAGLARDLTALDPLDVDLLLILARSADDEAERGAALRRAYELEPTAVIEDELRAVTGGADPVLSDSGLARIYRRAGMYEQAALHFASSDDEAARSEEIIEHLRLGGAERLRELCADPRTPHTLVRMLTEALLRTAEEDDAAARAALETLFAYDPELEQCRRYIGDTVIELLPLQRAEIAYSIEAQGSELTLVPWHAADDIDDQHPTPPVTEVATEDRSAPIPVETAPDEDAEEVLAPAEDEVISEPAPEPAPAEDAPASESEAVRLAAYVAAVPGVIRALVIDPSSRTLANAPARDVDPIEAKLLATLIGQVRRMNFVRAVTEPLEDVRIRAGSMTVYAVFDVLPETTLIFIADEKRFLAERVRTAIAEALGVEEQS